MLTSLESFYELKFKSVLWKVALLHFSLLGGLGKQL